MGLRRLTLAVLLGAAAALCGVADARADEAPARRRILGFGTAQGPNVAAATLWTSRGRVGAGTGAALLGLALPTFELQLFAPKLYSIDLATSLGGTLFAASLDRALYFTQDVYCTFHLGRGIARFIAGPGVGFTSAFHEDERGVQNGGSLRLVSQLGLELLTNNEAFGFKLLGRPWLEVSHVQAFDDQRTFVGGGFAQQLAFFGYFRD